MERDWTVICCSSVGHRPLSQPESVEQWKGKGVAPWFLIEGGGMMEGNRQPSVFPNAASARSTIWMNKEFKIEFRICQTIFTSFVHSHCSIRSPTRAWSCAAVDRSASRQSKYCRWPSQECDRSTVRFNSLLFVQSARRLQLSIWLCSGPWWLKFSDQPKSRISRTLWRILWAFSKFQPLTPPVLSGMFSLSRSSSSTDKSWSFSSPAAVRPNRRCCMSHRSAARRTSIISSLGSTIGARQCSGYPCWAFRIASFTKRTCLVGWNTVSYMISYMILIISYNVTYDINYMSMISHVMSSV